MIFDWSNDDATATHSRRFPCKGPAGSTTAAAIPATNADLPFPRATDSAACPDCPNAPRMNLDSHGNTVNGEPSWSPPASVSPPR